MAVSVHTTTARAIANEPSVDHAKRSDGEDTSVEMYIPEWTKLSVKQNNGDEEVQGGQTYQMVFPDENLKAAASSGDRLLHGNFTWTINWFGSETTMWRTECSANVATSWRGSANFRLRLNHGLPLYVQEGDDKFGPESAHIECWKATCALDDCTGLDEPVWNVSV
ncbi:hypothetical protein IAT40_001555 [Kwoniella sp. CBS 6097]